MTSIDLNNSTSLDLGKLIDSRLLIQANSGGGKSWLIRRLLEQSHGKVQQIVLDLEGEFGTLREKHDYILAGKGGDTPVDSRSAALLAKRLLEMKVSAIIDLYELHHQERKHFVRLFLEAMINAPKELWHPVMVVIDEAHVFVPEKGESEAAGAVIDLCTRGRKRGFCAVLATQRLSKLHKDAAAECNNKLIGRASQDIDMKRSAEELGFTSKEQTLSLRTLKPGEFYAFGPAISDEVQKLTVGEVETSHPKAGARSITSVVPPTEKIRKILGQLADLPKEAAEEVKTMEGLRAEIRSLKAHRCSQAADPKMLEREVRKNVELCEKFFKHQIIYYREALSKIAIALENISSLPKDPKFSIKIDKNFVQGMKKAEFKVEVKAESGESDQVLSGPERKVLDALALFLSFTEDPTEKAAVALVAGYSPNSGGYNNLLGKLRSKNLINYPKHGFVALTLAGMEEAKMPEADLTTEDLQRRILEHLSNPEAKLLNVLIHSYPNDISSAELAEATGYSAESGGFNNLKGRLRTMGLVEYPVPGRIKARSILFL